MFKDNKNGQTHYYNDGCGELKHNDMPKFKASDFEKGLEQTFMKSIKNEMMMEEAIASAELAGAKPDWANSLRRKHFKKKLNIEKIILLIRQTIKEEREKIITYISHDQGWEESGDKYREHYNLPKKYVKRTQKKLGKKMGRI